MSQPAATKPPATWRKKLGWAAAILIGLLALWTAVFWQEITVYREFKRLCETDAGLKVFEKLEPGQVWLADSLIYARSLVSRPEIALARAPDEKGKLVDVRALTHGWQSQSEVAEVDASRVPRYRLVDRSFDESTDPVLTGREIEISDLSTKRAMSRERTYLFVSSRTELPDSLFPWDHPFVVRGCPTDSGSAQTYRVMSSLFR